VYDVTDTKTGGDASDSLDSTQLRFRRSDVTLAAGTCGILLKRRTPRDTQWTDVHKPAGVDVQMDIAGIWHTHGYAGIEAFRHEPFCAAFETVLHGKIQMDCIVF
jgi:hypothetical protein